MDFWNEVYIKIVLFSRGLNLTNELFDEQKADIFIF